MVFLGYMWGSVSTYPDRVLRKGWHILFAVHPKRSEIKFGGAPTKRVGRSKKSS